MIDVNELLKGVTFELDGSLYKVLDYSHNKTGPFADLHPGSSRYLVSTAEATQSQIINADFRGEFAQRNTSLPRVSLNQFCNEHGQTVYHK